MTAKKPPAKRKPRPKKTVDTSPAVPAVGPSRSIRSHLAWLAGLCVLVISFVGVWKMLPIEIDQRPANDVLSQAYAADRITQVAVLRELDSQGFDATKDDGRKKAADFFNANRFRNRPADYRVYTDAFVDSFERGELEKLAKEIEGVK